MEAALAMGDHAAAQEFLTAVDAQPRGLRSRFADANAHRFRARMAADPEQAQSQLRTAVDVLRRLEIPFWRAVCQLELAQSLAGGAEADALLADARAVFSELQAAPWLERALAAESVANP